MTLEWVAATVLDPGVPALLICALVFGSCILESFFPPWPTDVIVLYAGFLAGRGRLDVTLVFLAAVLGTQVGVIAVFVLARRWGEAVLAGHRLGRFVSLARLAQLERWFARWGAPAIAVSRFMPGLRALVMPAAGLARFPMWKVIVWAGVSVVVWNACVVGLGYEAGTHLEWAQQMLARYNTVAAAVVGSLLVTGGLVLLYRRLVRRRLPSP
jgi:membrane protein DedA with SNARE-associated domain